jgi:hypothetical protein
MGVIHPLAWGLIAALAGCKPADTQATSRDGSHTTPTSASPWRVGATWRFTETNLQGQAVRTFVFRIAGEPETSSCMSGDLRQLERVEGDASALSHPAWTQETTKLTIYLTSSICDAYRVYVGTLKGAEFEGRSGGLGLGGFNELGTVRGVALP